MRLDVLNWIMCGFSIPLWAIGKIWLTVGKERVV